MKKNYYVTLIIEDYWEPEDFFVREDMVEITNGKITKIKNHLVKEKIEHELEYSEKKLEQISVGFSILRRNDFLMCKRNRSGKVKYAITKDEKLVNMVEVDYDLRGIIKDNPAINQ